MLGPIPETAPVMLYSSIARRRQVSTAKCQHGREQHGRNVAAAR